LDCTHCVDRAQNVVDIARGQQRLTLDDPGTDFGHIFGCQLAVAMRLDVAILDVDHGDFFHVDPALTVLGVHAEHRSTIVADAEVIVWKIASHGVLQVNDAQNVWMRVQASRNTSSAVA
jgi:hypothetical protein